MFDPSAALSAAKLCQRAYSGPNVIADNTKALVLRDPLRCAIAGTDIREPADWLHDARLWGEDLGQGARVHRGFLAHYRALWPSLGPMLTARAIDAPPELSGHSLGAACAVLCVWHRPYLFKGSSVYLFGCPAVGNGNFAVMFDRLCRDNGITVWNVQSRGDLVCIRALFREHVGKTVEVGEGWDIRPDHPITAYQRELEAMI